MIANLRARLTVWYNQPNPPVWKTGGFTLTVLGSLGYVAVNAWGPGPLIILIVMLLFVGAIVAARTYGRN